MLWFSLGALRVTELLGRALHLFTIEEQGPFILSRLRVIYKCNKYPERYLRVPPNLLASVNTTTLKFFFGGKNIMKSRLKYQGFEKPVWWYVYLLAMAGAYLVIGVLLVLGVLGV